MALAFLGLAMSVAHCVAAPRALTQTEVAREFEQRTWTREQGLPDDRVKALLQSRDGYIWVGTQRGLARFDGLKFTIFDKATVPSLDWDDCLSLAEDRDGHVWIGTSEKIICYDNGHFIPLTKPRGGISPGARMAPSRFGGLWAGSGGLLWRIACEKTTSYKGPKGLPYYPCALNEEESGTLLIGSPEQGLARFTASDNRFELSPLKTECEHLSVKAIEPGAHGQHWVLFGQPLEPLSHSDKQGWLLGCLKNNQWIRQPALGQPDFLGSGHSYFLSVDRFGAVWLPGDANGVHRFVNGEFQSLPLPHKGEWDIALCALSDREGNVWIGTESSGLQCWARRKFTTYKTRDGLANENVWSVCQTRDGRVLVGTDAGVSQFTGSGFTDLTPPQPKKEVRSVVEDQAGRIWVGTIRSLESIESGKTSPLKLPGEWTENKVRALLPARDGGVWIGTIKGLTHLPNGQQTKYSKTNGLGSDEVLALLEDRAGDLWVGTSGGGLSRLHSGTFTTLTTTNGLAGNNVWALFEDSEGVLWIGTDNGLTRLKNGQLTSFTTTEGLPDHEVNSILEDDFGRLWIGHDRGVYWVHKQQFNAIANHSATNVQAVMYGPSDGLASIGTNGRKSNPCSCKTRDGRLWFCTPKGIAVIDPSKVQFDEVGPLTVIEEVRANAQVVFGEKAFQWTSLGESNPQAPDAPVVRLPKGGTAVLEIHYTANTMLSSEKSRFRYRLHGLDEHWVEAGVRREAYFTDLRPGDYMFEVTACNHHGVWADHGAVIGLHIGRLYYQAWWFYACLGTGLAALIALGIRWRMGELRKMHQLEQAHALERQRQQIASDIHDELGASLTHIRRLSETTLETGGTPELLQARTRQVISTAEEAVDQIGELVWVNNPDYDTLQDLVAYLREYAAGFFNFSSIQVQFDFPETVPTRTVSGLFRRNCLMLLKEALQNIVKHSNATQVRLNLLLRVNLIELHIQDNGCGFVESHGPTKGHGLKNMRRRIEEIGGGFTLKSQKGHGTQIHVIVPLGAEAR